MIYRIARLAVIFVILLSHEMIFGKSAAEEVKNPYLGQPPPGKKAELFAPGIISRGMYERDIAMTPDGKEIYYCIIGGNQAWSAILVTKLVGGKWITPEVVPFSGDPRFRDAEPHVSPDGKRFYFVSNRPDAARKQAAGNWDIWVARREGNRWGMPFNLGAPVNSELGEYFPTVTRDGTLYFARGFKDGSHFIYRSRLWEGKYSEPERLGPEVNTTKAQFNAFIAPDESYLIVPIFGRKDTLGSTDYYICFRSKEDKWSGPFNMGKEINTALGLEYSPYVSPDGKYFFFMSTRTRELEGRLSLGRYRDLHESPQNGNPDIYWMDAGIIEELRAKHVGQKGQ